jgi:hypothetical protein
MLSLFLKSGKTSPVVRASSFSMSLNSICHYAARFGFMAYGLNSKFSTIVRKTHLPARRLGFQSMRQNLFLKLCENVN